MTSAAYRRWVSSLAVAVTLLAVLCCWLFWKHAWLVIEVAFATEQTEIFDDMRAKSLAASNPAEIAGYLEYAVRYYPSGTKQRQGSQLDLIVERYRSSVVQDIIAQLRSKTGHDFGNDPQPWIAEYSQD